MEEERKICKPSAFDNASIFSKIFFLWMIPIFKKGNGKRLEYHDLYSCSQSDDPEKLTETLQKEWNKEVELMNKSKKKKASIIQALFRSFGWRLLIQGQMAVLPEFIHLGEPFIIRLLILYLAKDDVVSKEIALYCAYGMIITTLVYSVVRHHGLFACGRMGANWRYALTSLIFKKMLRVSKSAADQADVGQTLNVIANDLFLIDQFFFEIGGLVSGPLMSLAVLFLTWKYLGIASIGGYIIQLLFFPFLFTMNRMFNRFRLKTTNITDKRVRLMSEILSASKLIKMYCWEQPFARLVDTIRTQEIIALERTFTLWGISGASSYVGTRLMMFASFFVYVLLGNELTPEIVFVVMSLYNGLRTASLYMLPLAVNYMGECLVAEKRVMKLLLLNEKEESVTNELNEQKSPQDRGRVTFKNYCGKWNRSLPNKNLDNINLNIEPGQLVVVVGSVGSGKTCLLWSLLKEIENVSGTCQVSGSVSYAPQESFCFGGTIKENILVGSTFLQHKYNHVIKAAGLERDLTLFSDGDNTFVGEKGYTLSGGQKARVTLARALYNEADIYLLDDPLSAVDPKVANHIFDKSIKEYLKGKTVILVTHQLQFLNRADKVLVLNEGKAVGFGSYEELSSSNSDFLAFLNTKQEEEKRKESVTKEKTLSLRAAESEEEDKAPQEPKPESKAGNSSTESSTSGSVSLKVYWNYLTSGGSIWLIFLSVFVGLISQFVFHFTDLWLSAWTANSMTSNSSSESTSLLGTTTVFKEQNYNLILYCILMAILFIGSFLRASLVFKLCLKCSINLHDRIFKRVLRAPMLFFENTPIGQILNRFTRDMGVVDQNIPSTLSDLNFNWFQTTGTIIVSCIINPWLIIPCIILSIVCYFAWKYYIEPARDLQRLEATLRSPIYSHVSSTFDGLITVRAFGLQKMFDKQFTKYLTDSTSCKFLVSSSSRSFAIFLELLVIGYIAAVTLGLVYLPKGTISGGDAGVILTSTMLLVSAVQWLVRQSAEFETQMVSAERIFEYGKLQSEAELKIPGKVEDKTWPREGSVVFDRVGLRYSPDLPHVLKQVSFKIKAGEHIGVVGRTGAGKSSLISVLFRLVEPEGKIIIDGVDIKTLGLHELRQKISIIPQDPSLFSGSLRRNLDPFEEFNDDIMWQVLREANLTSAVMCLPGGLDGLVMEGGSNLSVGQKQLLCLARCLLKNNKILVMDEATANVDPETDAMIQRTIRTKFTDCTVITVAHRLNTIIDMDKILVMDAGQVIEFDAGHSLLKDRNGLFYSMVHQTGPDFEKMLHSMAKKHYFDKLPGESQQITEIDGI